MDPPADQPSDQPSDQPADTLADLAARSMLELDAASGRYVMPREVVEYVREHADATELAAGLDRLAAWARDWATRAGPAERTADESAWLVEFDGVHRHLEAAIARTPEVLAQAVLERACWCWVRSGRAGVVQELASGTTRDRLALASGSGAERAKDNEHPFDASLERARHDLAGGELAEAWNAASAALADRRQVGDAVGEAEALAVVSAIALERDRPPLAARMAQSASAAARSAKAGGVLGASLLAEARALRALGQTVAAIRACREAAALAEAGRLISIADPALDVLTAIASEQGDRRAGAWREVSGDQLWDALAEADTWARSRQA